MSKHILVIDDDQLLRRSLAFNLVKRANYRVSTAPTAEEGLALARTDRPDLVLLDINLPGMDGLDGLRSFQAEMSVPILFLTARRREIDQVIGLELGAEDYITKPFVLDVLLARIKIALRRGPPAPLLNRYRHRWWSGTSRSISRRILSPSPVNRSCSHPASLICSTHWHVKRGDRFPSRRCWTRSGAPGMSAKHKWSMCTFGGCARNSKPIQTIPAAS